MHKLDRKKRSKNKNIFTEITEGHQNDSKRNSNYQETRPLPVAKFNSTLKDRTLDPYSRWNDKILNSRISLQYQLVSKNSEPSQKSVLNMKANVNKNLSYLYDSFLWNNSGDSILVNSTVTDISTYTLPHNERKNYSIHQTAFQPTYFIATSSQIPSYLLESGSIWKDNGESILVNTTVEDNHENNIVQKCIQHNGSVSNITKLFSMSMLQRSGDLTASEDRCIPKMSQTSTYMRSGIIGTTKVTFKGMKNSENHCMTSVSPTITDTDSSSITDRNTDIGFQLLNFTILPYNTCNKGKDISILKMTLTHPNDSGSGEQGCKIIELQPKTVAEPTAEGNHNESVEHSLRREHEPNSTVPVLHDALISAESINVYYQEAQVGIQENQQVLKLQNAAVWSEAFETPVQEDGETVYEGLGEDNFGVPVISEFLQAKQKAQSVMESLEERIVDLFQECNPNSEGLVMTAAISENIFMGCEAEVPRWVLESITDKLKEAGSEISYEVFHRKMSHWVESIIEESPEERITDAIHDDDDDDSFSTLKTEPLHTADFGLINQSASNLNGYDVDYFEDNRRSTLLPGRPKWHSHVTCDVFNFPSPIKPFGKCDSEHSLVKRVLDHGYQEEFDFTYGSIETDTNSTTLDPVELQQQLLELTHSNRKLTGEKEELAAHLSRSEEEHQSMKERIHELEEALNIAHQQATDSHCLQKEIYELKAHIEFEKERVVHIEEVLLQCQGDNEELQHTIKILHSEVEVTNEKLENGLRKEEETDKEIATYIVEITLLKGQLNECDNKLQVRDEKIENLLITIEGLENMIQSLQEEKLQILQELREKNQQLDDSLPTLQELYDGNIDEDVTLSTSELTARTDSYPKLNLNQSTEEESSRPRNIKDEIITLDHSPGSLPFCEKEPENSTVSTVQTTDDPLDITTCHQVGDQYASACQLSFKSCTSDAESCPNYSQLLPYKKGHFCSERSSSSSVSFVKDGSPFISNETSATCNTITNPENLGLPEMFLKNTGRPIISHSAVKQNLFTDSHTTLSFSSWKTLISDQKILEHINSLDSALALYKRDVSVLTRKNVKKYYYEFALIGLFMMILSFTVLLNKLIEFEMLPDTATNNRWDIFIPTVPFMQFRYVGTPAV